ncbi:hypothetical protein ACJX0J_036134 [Zea mays]
MIWRSGKEDERRVRKRKSKPWPELLEPDMGWDSITNTMLIPRKHDYLLGLNVHALFLLSTFTTDEKNKGRIRELEQEEGSPTQLIDLLLSLENKIVLILKQHFFPESDFFGFHFSPFKEDLGF